MPPPPASPRSGAPPEADAGELARVAAEIQAEDLARRPAPAPGAAAARRAVVAGDDREAAAEALLSMGEDVAEGKVDVLTDLTADEIGDFFALCFGVAADFRGPHWELEKRSSDRLGKWFKKVIDRHGLGAAAKWVPEIFAGALLFFETGKRWRKDKELAAAAAATEPAAQLELVAR